MIRVGDADIRRRLRRNIRNNVVVNFTVIRVELQIDRNIRVECLKIRDRFFVNIRLTDVRVVFCPERDLILLCRVEALRHFKCSLFLRAVTSGQPCCSPGQTDERHRTGQHLFPEWSHPFTPPCDTPAIIFLRNTKNSTISGTEITTTAAIMAGIFSLPKPFSRIS